MKFLIVVSVLISSAFAAHIHARSGAVEYGYAAHRAHPMTGDQEKSQWEQSKIAEKTNLVSHRTYHMAGAEAKSQFEQSNIAEKSPITAHRSHPMNPNEEQTQWEQSKIAVKSNLVAHRAHPMTNAEAKSQFEQSNIAAKFPITAHRSHPMSPNQEKTQWENPIHAENAIYAHQAHQQKSDAEEQFEIEQPNYPVHAARHQHHFKSDAARPNPVAEQEEFISMREAHPEHQPFEHQNAQESPVAEKRAMMMPAMNQARASMHRPRGQMRAFNVPMY